MENQLVSEIFIVPRLLVGYPNMPEMLKTACFKAAELNQGLTVPQFIAEMSDDELQLWLELAGEARNDTPLLIAMSVFCALLAVSEGLVVQDTDNLADFVSVVSVMIQAEMLSREGLLALDLSTLTLEKFDVTTVPRTPLGMRSISKLQVIRVPRQ
jgi:hypothetical protein